MCCEIVDFFRFLEYVCVVEGGGCGVKDCGVVNGFVVDFSEALCLEGIQSVEASFCECSRLHAVCEH